MTKNYQLIVGAMFIGSLLVSVTSSAAPANKNETQIRNVVENHFKGVITADAKLLNQAWDVPNAHLKYILTDAQGKETALVKPMKDMIKAWTEKASPNSKGKIIDVQVAGDHMAFVNVEFDWVTDAASDNLKEFLVLFKTNGTWKLVNKTYVVKHSVAKMRTLPRGGYGG